MALDNLGDHSQGGTITEGQDTKEDTSNDLDNLIENSQNKPADFVVTAGGTFQLNISGGQGNLDIFRETGLLRLTGSPGAATTIIVADGNKRIAIQNASGQATTINTVSGAAAPVQIANGATKTIHVRGTEFTIIADDATQTGAMLADGSTPASGDHDWLDFQLQRPLLIDYSEGYVLTSPAASVDFDLELGNVFDITMDQATVFTFSNPPASGRVGSFTAIFRQDVTGGRTITLPGSVNWEQLTPPTFSNSGDQIDVVSFLTVDGGTTWFAFLGGLNFG